MHGLASAILALAAATAVLAADPCATTVGTVSGTVTSGGSPIAGARVRVRGCLGDPVLTDAAGGFTVAVPASASVVTAAADGHYNECWKAATSECVGVGAGTSGLAIAL